MITTRKHMQFNKNENEVRKDGIRIFGELRECKARSNSYYHKKGKKAKSERTKTKIKYLKEEKTMREKMEFVEDFFAEDREITVVEFFLALLVAFLFGMVWGMFLSPKGTRVIGSNNGNNNAGYISDRGDDDEDDEE